MSLGEELVIGLGNFPPLFSTSGSPALFKDLIDGVYRYIPDKTITYRYMLSNARLEMGLNIKSLDGAANIFSNRYIQGCITEPLFGFFDVAISKKDRAIDINDVHTLANYSVVSYQGATKLLGPEYKKAVAHASYYKEVPNPIKQAKLLSSGLVDVSIGDKYIFLHSLAIWSRGKSEASDYVFHPIFPPVASSMGFIKQEHCDEFDQALVKFKASGEYQKVYDKHLQRFY
ncbi:ABC transporter substrate-binding protein [Colwellia sp. 1_MG-2023]|uniref:substrate-binding periplasmic protein n=1 Tax=Colwellia sp. 1_MG-2023 TaxID=3062649 RepID=UPI0026E319D9|nr:ABC transporter substrate-binding protein [Colwellia sp. 1_MG-2023]MDO6445377.1 ABC transporter substrate-binding protein [Colwellia sp. 1_MG-2023]